MSDLLEKCRSYLLAHEPTDLVQSFEAYCKGYGFRKADNRRNDNTDAYQTIIECYHGAKCECMLYNTKPTFDDIKLYLVMRKRNGNPYFIIGRNNGDRAVEVGIDTAWCYDESKLREIMAEHVNLFERLGI